MQEAGLQAHCAVARIPLLLEARGRRRQRQEQHHQPWSPLYGKEEGETGQTTSETQVKPVRLQLHIGFNRWRAVECFLRAAEQAHEAVGAFRVLRKALNCEAGEIYERSAS